MKSKLAKIADRLDSIVNEIEAVSQLALEDESNGEELLAQVESLETEFSELKAEQEKLEKLQARVDEIIASRVTPDLPNLEPKAEELPEPTKEPAKPMFNSSKIFKSHEDHKQAAHFFGAIAGRRESHDFMADQSLTNDKGGYSVPQPLAAELINLLNDYGVARNVCRRVTMGATTWSIPKLAGHATIYYPNEAQAITASDLTFDQATLTAKKMAALVKFSTEISEDSLLSMADEIVRDIAWGMSKAEDENLFNGGSIYSDGIVGDAGVAGVSAADLGSITLGDLRDVTVAASGVNNRGLNHRWYMNPVLWNGQVRELLDAAPGNTSANFTGGNGPSLFGYPVELVNALPVSGAGAAVAVFGDLGVSHYFGDRRDLNFKVLDQTFAVNDQLAIMATQRIDIASVNPEVLAKLTIAA